MGVFGDENLFNQRSFAFQEQTDAVLQRNGFYSYYANNEIPGEPFGFAAKPDIYLGPFDFFGSCCKAPKLVSSKNVLSFWIYPI